MSRLPEELNRSFEQFEILGDCHHSTSLETPMRADAWELSSETKMQRIEEHFREIMHTPVSYTHLRAHETDSKIE